MAPKVVGTLCGGVARIITLCSSVFPPARILVALLRRLLRHLLRPLHPRVLPLRHLGPRLHPRVLLHHPVEGILPRVAEILPQAEAILLRGVVIHHPVEGTLLPVAEIQAVEEILPLELPGNHHRLLGILPAARAVLLLKNGIRVMLIAGRGITIVMFPAHLVRTAVPWHVAMYCLRVKMQIAPMFALGHTALMLQL